VGYVEMGKKQEGIVVSEKDGNLGTGRQVGPMFLGMRRKGNTLLHQ